MYPSLQDSAVVEVEVKNVPEPPTVESDTVTLDEKKTAGWLVHTIEANDPDTGKTGLT